MEYNSFEVRDATAIVTGAGHGIGRAMAEALAQRGANVVVADINIERAAKIANRIGGLAVRCDVGDPDSVDALVSAALRTFGPVDI
ncbi:MAG: SDR family NAD(P)-dependent oxidoreductase, partial [Mycobacterium sp.]